MRIRTWPEVVTLGALTPTALPLMCTTMSGRVSELTCAPLGSPRQTISPPRPFSPSPGTEAAALFALAGAARESERHSITEVCSRPIYPS
jgi:hypothetical protein